MAWDEERLQELARLPGLVLQQTSLHDTLVEICRVAVRAVPGADGASLTTFAEGGPAATASDEWAKALDELQYEEHEGPCLDALRSGNVFRVPDLGAEPRWPSYVPRARARGTASMISLPMSAEGRLIGALNLYSKQAQSFDADAVSIAELVAGHAGLAAQVSTAFFRHRDLAGQLSEAMRSRATIEQAKGVVMARHGGTPDEAFAALVRLSQRSNRKVRDVAAEVVEEASRQRRKEE